MLSPYKLLFFVIWVHPQGFGENSDVCISTATSLMVILRMKVGARLCSLAMAQPHVLKMSHNFISVKHGCCCPNWNPLRKHRYFSCVSDTPTSLQGSIFCYCEENSRKECCSLQYYIFCFGRSTRKVQIHWSEHIHKSTAVASRMLRGSFRLKETDRARVLISFHVGAVSRLETPEARLRPHTSKMAQPIRDSDSQRAEDMMAEISTFEELKFPESHKWVSVTVLLTVLHEDMERFANGAAYTWLLCERCFFPAKIWDKKALVQSDLFGYIRWICPYCSARKSSNLYKLCRTSLPTSVNASRIAVSIIWSWVTIY